MSPTEDYKVVDEYNYGLVRLKCRILSFYMLWNLTSSQTNLVGRPTSEVRLLSQTMRYPVPTTRTLGSFPKSQYLTAK